MILYHGSNQKITKINLQKSKPGKDFGRAFYLSAEETQALEMAKFKKETYGGNLIINKFYFDESNINNPDLKYKQFDSYTEEWARFILTNRQNTNETQAHNIDIIFGPIANDRIGRQIFNFTSGYIDFETFIKRIQYPEGITYQWAFCTPAAIRLLTPLE